MAEPCCANCWAWVRQGAALAAAARDPSMSFETGACQARQPVVIATPYGNGVSMYPVTHESRCCGDWDAADLPAPDPDDGEQVPTAEVIRIDRIAA